jgi:pimeloyl-ACP methyl ester carboxylesterase
LQKPKDVTRPPVLISIGGSDLWKDTVAIQSRAFLAHGIAVLALDMPGTGDAPLPAAPGSERIFSAAIDYVTTRSDLDGTRIVLRGQSWGSYWAARTGYAEVARLAGVVFQSGPVHHYFQRAWQEEAFKTKEFLFDYVPSRLHMLGQHTVEEAFALMPRCHRRRWPSADAKPADAADRRRQGHPGAVRGLCRCRARQPKARVGQPAGRPWAACPPSRTTRSRRASSFLGGNARL